MSTAPVKIPQLDQNVEITKIFEFIKSLFETIQLETKSSEELFKLGIETSFTKAIRLAMEDPMGQLYGSITELHKHYSEILIFISNNILNLSVIKEMSANIFLEKNTGDSIIYHIVLKDNTLENRSKVRKLLNSYNDSEESLTFPIFLQFLDEVTYTEIKKEYSNSKRFIRIDG